MPDRILLVYYSRSGTTATLARAIAEATGADVEELVDTVRRSGALGFVRSVRDAAARRPSAIEPLTRDPAVYDLVVVGGPDWGGAASGPVRTFLQSRRGRLPRVAFFLTDGTSDHEKVFRDMAELAGTDPVATLGVPHDEVRPGGYEERVEAFARALRESA
ncbi:MAG TPA: flavodoxin [Gaiellaceae bacterium]|nr:flavodoxin [Gaiellaceae bacterium]